MSSVFRYIKRKFQPLKKQLSCASNLGSPSSSSRTSSYDNAKSTPDRKQHSLCEKSKAIRKRSKSGANCKRNLTKARHALQSVDNPVNVSIKKPKRSNATYTVENAAANVVNKPSVNHNSRIVDYFKNLEIKRGAKRKSTVRPISPNELNPKQIKIVSQSDNAAYQVTDEHEPESNGNESIEDIEKLQDEFFNDGSSRDISAKPSILAVTQTTSSPISVSSNSFASQSFSIDGSPLNDNNQFLNRSIEKIRRSVSSPKVGLNLNSTACARNSVSRLSLIKDLEPESTIKMNSTITGPNMTETMGDIPATVLPPLSPSASNMSLSQSQEGNFVRGEPSTRLSKNIKRMFKSVIEHQTSALQTLEKFYECQINRIEMERANVLAITADDQKERINLMYDQQLRVLEQRVQINLKRLLDNKAAFSCKPPTNQNQHVNRLAQFMLIKQLQIQQQQQIKPNQRNQCRTRTLSGLKASLISANQCNLLPSRAQTVGRRVVDSSNGQVETVDSSSGDEIGNGEFRRNLSLPFKHPRQKPQIIETKQSSPRGAPNGAKLVYSSSRVSSCTNCPPSPSLSQNQRQAKPPTFVKNSAQKKQQIMEVLRRTSGMASNGFFSAGNEADDEDSSEIGFRAIDKSPITSVPTASIIGPTTFAAYSNIKRENHARSASLIKPEPIDSKMYSANLNDRQSLYSINKIINDINRGQQQSNTMKFLSPRLSDGHLQYKIKHARENIEPVMHQSSSYNQIVSMHETEV